MGLYQTPVRGNTLSYSQQLLLLIKPKMPLKLTYSDLRARAEPTRLILAQAGVEFEDERLPAPWDDMAPWTAMKPTTPFGVLPILCVDGTKICQSMTIARYCGHAYGLGGKNAMENAQMDEIVDAVSDFTETVQRLSLKRTRLRRPSCRKPTQRRPDPSSSSSWRLACACAAENTLWAASRAMPTSSSTTSAASCRASKHWSATRS